MRVIRPSFNDILVCGTVEDDLQRPITDYLGHFRGFKLINIESIINPSEIKKIFS